MIELRVLGSLELKQHDGTQVLSVLTQPKRAALFSYLAVTSSTGPRRRDEIMALFWPDLDSEHARASLRQALYFLRRSLGDAVIATRGDDEIGIDPSEVWCDVRAFEELLHAGKSEAALELYRGELLPGLLLEGAPDFVEWLERERARLAQRAAQAAWEVADARRTAGENAAAAEWARRALLHQPLDEASVARCMRLLEAVGERTEALRIYAEYVRRLDRDLELEPSEALSEYARALRPNPVRTQATSAPPATPIPPSPALTPRSIAVLPFLSMSPNPDDAYLSDGLTDEIITTLSKIPGLRVSARTSSFVYKGRSLDVRDIGRQLNVATVLEGSVQRSRDRLRITAQLIECAEGFHLWSSHWDSEMRDVFTIEDEIAANVSAVLRTVLKQPEGTTVPRLPRTTVQAYEHYLRGREYFLRTRRRDMQYARELFAKAIAADPDYALAHAALADTIAVEHMYYPASQTDLAAAERASQRALELDHTLAEAHSARANVLFQLQRCEEAEAAFRQALHLDPQLFEAHYFFARMCFQTGRLAEAADLFERAGRIREDYQAAFFGAQALEALGQHRAALERYQLALDVSEAHMDLHPDDPRAANTRAVALCRLGHLDEGLAWGQRAIELDPQDAGVRYNVACLYAVAGRFEDAVALIEEVVALGFGNRGWLERDPDLDGIRNDARFQKLLAEMR